MSMESFGRAFDCEQFHGEMRLAYLAIGDGGGIASIPTIQKWVNCDVTKAMTLVINLLTTGHLQVCDDGTIYCPDLLDKQTSDLIFGQQLKPPVPKPDRRQPDRDLRSEVFARDGRRCVYCGDEDGPFHLDHVFPFSRGGKTVVANLVVACQDCNLEKKTKTVEEWVNAGGPSKRAAN